MRAEPSALRAPVFVLANRLSADTARWQEVAGVAVDVIHHHGLVVLLKILQVSTHPSSHEVGECDMHWDMGDSRFTWRAGNIGQRGGTSYLVGL